MQRILKKIYFPQAELSWEHLGFWGIAAFSIGLFASTSLTTLGLGFMIFSLIMKWKKIGQTIFHLPLFWLSVCFFIYLIGYSIYLQTEFPGTLDQQIAASVDWIRLGFFLSILLGVWIAFWPRTLKFIPLWLSLGFCLRFFYKLPQIDWSQGFATRPGFGMPVTAFGLYSSIVLFWLLFFLRKHISGSILRIILWGIGVVISFGGILISLSRGAILSLVIFFPLFFVADHFFSKTNFSLIPKRKICGYCALVLLSFGIAAYIFYEPIIARTEVQEIKEIARFFQEENQEFVPEELTSMGTRLFIWEKGYDLWKEKFLFGWGPRKVGFILKNYWEDYKINHVTDFHNSYLEILVRLGCFGFLFFLLMFFLAFKSLKEGVQSRFFSFDILFFIGGSLFLFAFSTGLNDRLGDHLGRGFLSLFLGICYSYRIRKSLEKRNVLDSI